MRDLYGGEHADFLASLRDEDVTRLARLANNGLHVASPVFDGASESESWAFWGEPACPIQGRRDYLMVEPEIPSNKW